MLPKVKRKIKGLDIALDFADKQVVKYRKPLRTIGGGFMSDYLKEGKEVPLKSVIVEGERI